jgi:hypothetical protein
MHQLGRGLVGPHSRPGSRDQIPPVPSPFWPSFADSQYSYHMFESRTHYLPVLINLGASNELSRSCLAGHLAHWKGDMARLFLSEWSGSPADSAVRSTWQCTWRNTSGKHRQGLRMRFKIHNRALLQEHKMEMRHKRDPSCTTWLIRHAFMIYGYISFIRSGYFS